MGLFLSGIVIGFAIAAPVGPIGLLCLRRTIAGGFLVGFSSGLGAACADGCYAALAAGALGATSVYFTSLAAPLRVAGGVALIVLGARALRARRAAGVAAADADGGGAAHAIGSARAFSSTFALTIVNPSTIVSFGAIVAASRIGPQDDRFATLLFVGVIIGSALWWLALCAATSRFRRSLTPTVVRAIDLASGLGLIAWGVRALFP